MKRYLVAPLCAVFLLFGCGLSGGRQGEENTEVYIPDANSVGFDISPLAESGTSAWVGTYSVQGKTARFQFEFGLPQKTDQPMPSITVTFGKGRFVALADSDDSALLFELKKALEAKSLPEKVQRVKELSFIYANLGDHQSQAPDGIGFNEKPRGNWTPIKIFMGEGGSECEFFLNVNPVIRKGQFSMKDPDYGDQVLAQLAKVL